MDALNQIEKHQKAIKILELMKELHYRISSNKKMLNTKNKKQLIFLVYRLEIDVKIFNRLKNYYDKNFKI